ncbi:unnamed protein product [Amoebophrya sp. A25]|nr:unnamed protein product [Amoebophrya sp. A25]|eukprot:GSA25T00019603001.1
MSSKMALLKEVDGDLLNCGADFIVHQTNCVTTSAAGLAKFLFTRYPYADMYTRGYHGHGQRIPGKSVLCHPPSGRSGNKPEPIVVNLFGQKKVGAKPPKGDTREEREAWFKEGLRDFLAQLKRHQLVAPPSSHAVGPAQKPMPTLMKDGASSASTTTPTKSGLTSVPKARSIVDKTCRQQEESQGSSEAPFGSKVEAVKKDDVVVQVAGKDMGREIAPVKTEDVEKEEISRSKDKVGGSPKKGDCKSAANETTQRCDINQAASTPESAEQDEKVVVLSDSEVVSTDLHQEESKASSENMDADFGVAPTTAIEVAPATEMEVDSVPCVDDLGVVPMSPEGAPMSSGEAPTSPSENGLPEGGAPAASVGKVADEASASATPSKAPPPPSGGRKREKKWSVGSKKRKANGDEVLSPSIDLLHQKCSLSGNGDEKGSGGPAQRTETRNEKANTTIREPLTVGAVTLEAARPPRQSEREDNRSGKKHMKNQGTVPPAGAFSSNDINGRTVTMEGSAAPARPLTIAFPGNIGCGLAGGVWRAYRRMIEDFARDCSKEVVRPCEVQIIWKVDPCFGRDCRNMVREELAKKTGGYCQECWNEWNAGMRRRT